MSAFNWIDFKHRCPQCGTDQIIRAQTHVASDYDGDSSGRFHDEIYKLGETMRWWELSHKNYQKWKFGNRINIPNDFKNETSECCYSKCMNCNSNLYSVIYFVDCAPVKVLDLGIDSYWPDAYLK